MIPTPHPRAHAPRAHAHPSLPQSSTSAFSSTGTWRWTTLSGSGGTWITRSPVGWLGSVLIPLPPPRHPFPPNRSPVISSTSPFPRAYSYTSLRSLACCVVPVQMYLTRGQLSSPVTQHRFDLQTWKHANTHTHTHTHPPTHSHTRPHTHQVRHTPGSAVRRPGAVHGQPPRLCGGRDTHGCADRGVQAHVPADVQRLESVCWGMVSA